MKKLIVAVVSIFAICLASNGQDLAFEQSSNRINFGVGIPRLAVGGIKIPALYCSYEHGVVCFGNSVVGVGGEFEYSSSGDVNSVSGELFGKYHYNINSRFDVDGHIGLGYGAYGTVKSAVFNIGVDANYKIANAFGVFLGLEAGTLPGKAFLRGGIFLQF